DQTGRVDDDAVADHRRDVRVKHPGRDEVELVHLVAHDDGVSGVVAALIADDDLDGSFGGRTFAGLGEQVCDLALPFVPPLRPDHDGYGHDWIDSPPGGFRSCGTPAVARSR